MRSREPEINELKLECQKLGLTGGQNSERIDTPLIDCMGPLKQDLGFSHDPDLKCTAQHLPSETRQPVQPSVRRTSDCEGPDQPDDVPDQGAANVSTLPLSSPSQRLAQIRRQKNNCTRDEMFSELMKSSCTERAQQNAWRQTITEPRKAENEHEEKRREQDDRWRQHDERRQEALLRVLEDQTDTLRHMVDLEERQHEHRPPLRNRPPAPASSIASSSRCPRMRGGVLRTPYHSTPEDCPSNKRLAFNTF
nr:uncharacterized protein LOC125625208 [Caretta caretta]